MWSVASHVSADALVRPITLSTNDSLNVYDHTTWDSCRLEHPKLNGLVRDIQRAGVGTLEEASLFVIPALSCNGKLPSERVVELIQQRTRDNETNRLFEESIQVYSELLEFAKEGVSDRVLYKAVATVVEFLLMA